MAQDTRYYGTGKRKNAIARVWLAAGQGNLVVNQKDTRAYFGRQTLEALVMQPLEATDSVGKYRHLRQDARRRHLRPGRRAAPRHLQGPRGSRPRPAPRPAETRLPDPRPACQRAQEIWPQARPSRLPVQQALIVSILTVTLNACVDKAYLVPGFAVGGIFRPTRAVTTPAARASTLPAFIRHWAARRWPSAFWAARTATTLRRGLRAEGIPAAFVRVGGESRVCIKVMDPDSGAETELNENGPEVTSADADALLARLRELLPGRDAVILSGSMPPGTPPDLYSRIIALAQQEMGVKAILDTSGPALVSGAQAAPFLLKPNVHELIALGVDGDGWAGSAAR